MSDIVDRITEWLENDDIAYPVQALHDARAEIIGLRARLDEHLLAIRRLAGQDATLSVCEGNVTVETDVTLTDAEREAVKTAIGVMDWQCAYFSHLKHGEPLPSATLRGLLERLK